MNLTWNDVFKLAGSVIVSVGGAGFIIFCLSSWLGKVWASRILEKEKNEYRKELECYKNELDKLKTVALRYSGKQFELYNEFWCSLCDLEIAGDILMEEVNSENLKKFIKQFSETSLQIRKGFLFIESNHFNQLQTLLKNFENLEIGKEKLLKMREADGFDKRDTLKRILSNFIIQQNCKKLISEVGEDLKIQLKTIE